MMAPTLAIAALVCAARTVTLDQAERAAEAQAPVVPERDAAAMLQHVHETGDTARLYWAWRDYPVR